MPMLLYPSNRKFCSRKVSTNATSPVASSMNKVESVGVHTSTVILGLKDRTQLHLLLLSSRSMPLSVFTSIPFCRFSPALTCTRCWLLMCTLRCMLEVRYMPVKLPVVRSSMLSSPVPWKQSSMLLQLLRNINAASRQIVWWRCCFI